jgi:flavin-dependent dehydrogenase
MASAGQASARRFDVAVVGGSVAGCAAARLFAKAGATVALIERRPDPAAYKVTCTHAIQPWATAAIERLGLAEPLRAHGAVRTQFEFWTPYGGWFGFPDGVPDGWGVTRRTLDPMLRQLAIETPGVEYFPGWTATRVLDERDRTVGVEVQDARHRRFEIRSRLLVAADGRDSVVARLARVPGRVRPHNRFFYFAYWRGVRPATTCSRLWLLDPDAAAQFVNEADMTVLAAGCHRSRLPEFRANLEGAYLRHIRSLPDAPDLSNAEQVSKLIGKLEMPNVLRPASRPGIAFVGDAALATDPLFGVGLTFALASAQWLVDATAGALGDSRDLDRGLRRYRRKFLRWLGPIHYLIADFSTGRTTDPIERFLFRRATTADPTFQLALGEVAAGTRSPLHLLNPTIIARALQPSRASNQYVSTFYRARDAASQSDDAASGDRTAPRGTAPTADHATP